MVLLIPDAVKKIKAQGYAEGRAAQRKRCQAAYDRFGVEVDGVLMLPNTREVAEFLSGESEQKP